MAELARNGIYQPGLPPETGDCIVLDTESGPVDFFVYRIGKQILCEEDSEANRREFWFDDEKDLRWHTLKREAFYALMSGDFGIAGPVVRLDRGIWELGRRNIPSQGRAKVIFVEQGVEKNDLIACIARHGFKTNCLLFHGKSPAQISVPDRYVVASQVLVEEGRFVTEVFEDLVASRPDSIPETGVDLDSTPQRLVILGEEFQMPLHRGKPLIGLKYLAACFDRARQCIPVWDLFVVAKPGLSDNDSDSDDPEDIGEEDSVDTELVSTGMKRSVERPSIQPVWEDAKMDAVTRKKVGQDLAKKRKRLESLAEQCVTTGAEVRNLNKEVAELKKYLDGGQGIKGRKRALKHGDKEKARDSVRGGIKKVIEIVENQNPARAEELRSSLDLGYDVMFKPPPDWGI
jgi:hypothetical protein